VFAKGGRKSAGNRAPGKNVFFQNSLPAGAHAGGLCDVGKVDKFRECPAVGRRIKPIERRQNRGKNHVRPTLMEICRVIDDLQIEL
jgi:hypothetical protein